MDPRSLALVLRGALSPVPEERRAAEEALTEALEEVKRGAPMAPMLKAPLMSSRICLGHGSREEEGREGGREAYLKPFATKVRIGVTGEQAEKCRRGLIGDHEE
uniref:Uncharacterized protein n=1 Tax=Ananas comosus var. bracteatus TaxID=296719 RepID=A0A6V7Q0L5_ANACO|nr:unnamed protein product [Ananas comosus var. bracteatus]